MKLTNQKRLAADILKIGESRVWVDPERAEDVEEAITRDEVRGLIHEGAIKELPEKSVSRARVRIRREKRGRVLRRRSGSRKGKRTARTPKKEEWQKRIRVIRKHLRELLNGRVIQQSTYRRLYLLAKGGTFEDAGEVDQYVEAHRLGRRR